jgi:hypothetical protein
MEIGFGDFRVHGPGFWYADWAWGLPLIALNVVIHVLGLLLITERVEALQERVLARHRHNIGFVVVIATTALLATGLHSLEGLLWATAYLLMGAMPDYGSAALYSLNAMTSFGHVNLSLEPRWQLMGALEALNGMLLFGLTTATLIGIIQKAQRLRFKEML